MWYVLNKSTGFALLPRLRGRSWGMGSTGKAASYRALCTHYQLATSGGNTRFYSGGSTCSYSGNWQLESGNYPFSPSKSKQMCTQMCTYWARICATLVMIEGFVVGTNRMLPESTHTTLTGIFPPYLSLVMAQTGHNCTNAEPTRVCFRAHPSPCRKPPVYSAPILQLELG